jgi:hypothetical protein
MAAVIFDFAKVTPLQSRSLIPGPDACLASIPAGSWLLMGVA